MIVEGAVSASATFVAWSKIRQLLVDQGEFCHGRHKFCCDGGQLLHQRQICGDEVGHRSTISSGGGCKVSNHIDVFDVLLGWADVG